MTDDQKPAQARECFINKNDYEAAKDALDLGEHYHVELYLYPHKDDITDLIKMIEYSAYEEKCDALDLAESYVKACASRKESKHLVDQLEAAQKEITKLKFDLEAKQRPLGEQVLELTLELQAERARVKELEAALEEIKLINRPNSRETFIADKALKGKNGRTNQED